jgi:hypothetical protein
VRDWKGMQTAFELWKGTLIRMMWRPSKPHHHIWPDVVQMIGVAWPPHRVAVNAKNTKYSR